MVIRAAGEAKGFVDRPKTPTQKGIVPEPVNFGDPLHTNVSFH